MEPLKKLLCATPAGSDGVKHPFRSAVEFVSFFKKIILKRRNHEKTTDIVHMPHPAFRLCGHKYGGARS
jgi:hypothetical protein